MQPFYKNQNLWLALCAGALGTVCLLSLLAPIRFQHELERRGKEVRHHLTAIRKAEETYRQRHGRYTDSWQELTAEGLLADSVQYIPYSEGRCFTLATSVETTRSGQAVPLMECGARYEDYLQDLSPEAVARLTETADNEGRFAGLRIGSLESNTHNAGNWEQ